jgi:hypothetical protein
MRVCARIIPMVATLILAAVVAPAAAQQTLGTSFSGYSENPTLNSAGSGTLTLTVSDDGQSIDYVLTYQGLTAVSASHIHVGTPWLNGPVVIFLCGGGGRPACPSEGGTVEGTIVASDVTAGAETQGFPAGDLDTMLAALQSGVTYANVHTAAHGGGEIRGTISPQ